MEAYKTKLNIEKSLIKLQLPNYFEGKQVEIIVLEVGNNVVLKKTNIIENKQTEENSEPNEFQKFLLTAPTWSEEEYNNFSENRKLFNQWKIK